MWRRNFVNFLKLQSDDSLQDEIGGINEIRESKYEVNINLLSTTSEELIKKSFKIAEQNHINALSALRNGISLIFHFEGEHTDAVKIDLNREHFGPNDRSDIRDNTESEDDTESDDDTDPQKSDFVPIDRSDISDNTDPIDSDGKTIPQSPEDYSEFEDD